MKTEVAWGTLWRIFTFMAGITLVYFAWDAFAVLLVGVVISMGIDPFVTFLAEKARIGRVFSGYLRYSRHYFCFRRRNIHHSAGYL